MIPVARHHALTLVSLSMVLLLVYWSGSTPYPGIGVTVPHADARLVHAEPPPNMTGVPAGHLDINRDPMGSIWISAVVEGDAAADQEAVVYVPTGRVFLRGVASHIQTGATDEAFGVKRWKLAVALGEEAPVNLQLLCLEVLTLGGHEALFGACP